MILRVYKTKSLLLKLHDFNKPVLWSLQKGCMATTCSNTTPACAKTPRSEHLGSQCQSKDSVRETDTQLSRVTFKLCDPGQGPEPQIPVWKQIKGPSWPGGHIQWDRSWPEPTELCRAYSLGLSPLWLNRLGWGLSHAL